MTKEYTVEHLKKLIEGGVFLPPREVGIVNLIPTNNNSSPIRAELRMFCETFGYPFKGEQVFLYNEWWKVDSIVKEYELEIKDYDDIDDDVAVVTVSEQEFAQIFH